MTAPDAAEVNAAIRAGDAARARDLLRGAAEKERTALVRALQPLLQASPGSDASRSEWEQWSPLSDNVAFIAVMAGCAGGYRAAQRRLEGGPHQWDLRPEDYDAIAGVLADRRPSWLGQLVDRMLARSFERGFQAWPLARRLARLGAIGRPAADEYGLKMIKALAQLPPIMRQGKNVSPQAEAVAFGTGGDRLAAVLLDDPGLLVDEVWRLFTIPGAGKEMEWKTYYGYLPLGDQWADALVLLTAQRQLDRDRLIDACLDAFLRDFPPNHVAWYAQLHDRMRPSATEKAQRYERYLALLAAPGKPGVTVGQRGCAELLEAGLLEVPAFLAASSPALVYPLKSVATAQLAILGKLARQSAVGEGALATAAQAFAHQREDVQAAALQLIRRHGVPAYCVARTTITELAAFLSPVLRPEATALGLVPDQAPDETRAPAAAVAPAAQVALPVPRVVPVAGPAELVQLLAQLMEDAAEALAVERALDGAVRLSAFPLTDRAMAAEPLLKRARELAAADFSGPFSGFWRRADMAWLALTWATGQLPSAGARQGHGLVSKYWRHGAVPRAMSGILSARGWEACGLIADGHGLPLLATPEFADGSISHGELLARLERWPADGPRPPRTDLETAMLRLAPGAEGLLPDDLLPAYSAAQVPLKIEPYVALPKVTEHTRPDLPGLPGKTWQTVDGEAGVFARYVGPGQEISPECSRSGHLVTYLYQGPRLPADYRSREIYRSSEIVAAWPLLAPHHPELIAAHLLRALSEGLVPGRSAASTAVRALAKLNGAFGILGHVALVTGLASAEADARIAAAETWGQLTRDGRLDPVLAAGAITLGVNGTAFKLTRIADGLRYAAQDPAVAQTVVCACVSAAATLLSAADRPAALHLLLEVAAQAAALSGIQELPAPLADLAHGKARTKLADAARRLAALT